MYEPKPIDTSGVELPQGLIELTEQIAENVHNVWAKGRMDEGWVYGDEKNLEKKSDPRLVAYSRLPESEKDYDRSTALETLKMIVKLGYTISKN